MYNDRNPWKNVSKRYEIGSLHSWKRCCNVSRCPEYRLSLANAACHYRDRVQVMKPDWGYAWGNPRVSRCKSLCSGQISRIKVFRVWIPWLWNWEHRRSHCNEMQWHVFSLESFPSLAFWRPSKSWNQALLIFPIAAWPFSCGGETHAHCFGITMAYYLNYELEII